MSKVRKILGTTPPRLSKPTATERGTIQSKSFIARPSIACALAMCRSRAIRTVGALDVQPQRDALAGWRHRRPLEQINSAVQLKQR